MSIGSVVRGILRRFGYDIISFSPEKPPANQSAQRLQMIRQHKIGLILDVGANQGQYASYMRYNGYTGRIVSFEPLTSAFSVLRQRADSDPRWEVVNVALGSKNGSDMINVAGNSQSSSLLGMLPGHVKAAPESAYVTSEEVEIRTLDSLFEHLCPEYENVLLKIDTQGYELEVLKGARKMLPRVCMAQLEVSVVPLYEGAPLMTDVLVFMQAAGFSLMQLEPVLNDPATGQLLQLDATFCRLETT